MAATLTLDTITSSGSTITVPTGKTLAIADDGALTIGTPPVAITTGATQVTGTAATAITMATTGSPTINTTGKSASIVSVDASGGAAVTHTVTLPTPATFSTTSIVVVSRLAHGAGNKITINDSGGTEMYTLYEKGDHCELVSDGTNSIRTGNEFTTIYGLVTIDANYTMGASALTDVPGAIGQAGLTIQNDIAGWWNSTDVDLDIPAGYVVRFEGSVGVSDYGIGWMIRDGDGGDWLTAYYSDAFHYNLTDSPGKVELRFPTAKTVTFWVKNFTPSTQTLRGQSGANLESQVKWVVVRRI